MDKSKLDKLKSLYRNVANAGNWKFTPMSIGMGESAPAITVDAGKFFVMNLGNTQITREQHFDTHEFLVEVVNCFPEILEILEASSHEDQ